MQEKKIEKKEFGTTKDGRSVMLYTLKNDKGVIARVTDFGAILVNLIVPDKQGSTEDIVLGYDNVAGYEENGCFFGATIGPSANRIDNAAFKIDGQSYTLSQNDGTNNLHSDDELGYHKRIWDAVCDESKNCVVFSLSDEDGSMGFPGNKSVKVTYTLTDENELKISYNVKSDRNTLINMTNHTYFNLTGHSGGNIENHRLEIKASKYTPIRENLIPTGELAEVSGTPFDFTAMKTIGDDINRDNEQLKIAGGFDHNWVIDGYDGGLKKIAAAEAPNGGRRMEVYTDLPGVQFYAGNFITPQTGKQGASYGRRSGFCLETQAFPNSVNEPSFPDVIYGPGRAYETTTVYKFV